MNNKTNSTRSILTRICLIAMVVAVMLSIVACKSNPTNPTVPTKPVTNPTQPTDSTNPTNPSNPTEPTEPQPTEPQPTEPAFVYEPAFADNAWAAIADACQKNAVPDTWLVGDTKEMEINGQTYTVAIIGKSHDTYTDGGIAPLTFQVIDLVTTAKMNSTNSNGGGWTDSELRAMLNGDEFLKTLPDDVVANIKAVNKTTNIGGTDMAEEAKETVVTSSDKLFLLASVEVAGEQFWSWYANAYCDYLESLGTYDDQIAELRVMYENLCNEIKAEGKQYAYYAPTGMVTNMPTKIEDLGDNVGLNYWYNVNLATLNTLGEYSNAWWTRTPGAIYIDAFSAVNQSGNISDFFIIAAAELGVSFAFCF